MEAETPVFPTASLQQVEQKDHKSPDASAPPLNQCSKGGYDGLGVKLWDCSNKRVRINLAAWFG